MARSNEKSHQIIENIKKKKLAEIFRYLDSDGDGYISSTKIDIASVGTDILEAFAPLLCEMEELNQTLSMPEFIEAAEKLLRVFS
jgi:Ca2+-binding EF-hand superfamily protein